MDRKKHMIMFLIGLVSVIVGVILFTVLAGGFNTESYFVIIITALFLLFAIPRFILNRKDTVVNDEFSKRMLQVAAARSFYITLYTWLAMLWFAGPLNNLAPEPVSQIAIGIGIMAVVFLINALIIQFTGLKD